ncbi:hypothetical protein [Leptolyngbya iicbica]|uniref:Uncharacterized protein n=2 Tax=Cyanophyceae TaxID=3028117 RepID=A0A4Q7EGH7_9CYAN|nr:hypothetical protein [Leptolyngbya sp. LK]RZM82445.1 hypothetical protein DYY88_04165 [Leptolyngbya sp. LK]
MNLTRSLLWAIPFSVLTSLGSAALATTIELEVLPTLTSGGTCPEQLIAHETLRPYVEGSYSRDGMIKLRDIATNVRVVTTDAFSTTWTATLKPEFRDCEGSAIITRIDDEAFTTHSYLQVQLADGEVTAVLDMTGIPDANGYTSTLLFGGLREGNPRWTWGGSD